MRVKAGFGVELESVNSNLEQIRVPRPLSRYHQGNDQRVQLATAQQYQNFIFSKENRINCLDCRFRSGGSNQIKCGGKICEGGYVGCGVKSGKIIYTCYMSY